MAEFMTVEKNIVTGIFCGTAEERSITLPANHQVRVGEPLTFYNEDYTRKSEVQLMQEELIPIPQGYKIDDNNLVEMTYDEKIIAGLEQLPNGMKIVDDKILPMTEDEKLQVMTEEEKANYHRQKRDSLLNEVDTLLLKYTEQVELGIININEKYRLDLLKYKQALRDIPEQADFPENIEYPELPNYDEYE